MLLYPIAKLSRKNDNLTGDINKTIHNKFFINMPQCENINIILSIWRARVDTNINIGDIIDTRDTRAKKRNMELIFPYLGNHVSQELLFSRK